MTLLIVLLTLYGLWLLSMQLLGEKSWRLLMVDGLLALVFAAAHFHYYPSEVIYDDGGIVVRYMDQFAAGYFYSYNPEDGPVYGISGPLHGLLSGFLAFTGVFSPDHSVLASNAAGMFLVSLLLLRILRALPLSASLVFPAWALALLFSRYWLITSKQGLETPLHLAVVMAAILFYLRGHERRFWFFATLMVISKLDALPLAVLLAIGFLAQRTDRLRPISWNNAFYRRAILWAVPLGLIWLAFTFLVFDGPLPQSARAKLYHFEGPQGHWFPFLQPYIVGPFGLFAGGLFGLLAFHVLVLLVQKRPALIFRQCLFGLAAIGHFILYYFYNPAEQMPWYYTLPDLFLVTQGMITLFLALDALIGKWSPALAAVALAGYAVVIWPDMSARIIGHGGHFNVIEHERIAVGQWIDAQAGPDDKVLCGHGHIARESRRYVIDYTGLNSKKVTELKRDMNAIVDYFQPEWIVLHGRLEQNGITNAGYRLVKSFYNVSSIWASSAARNWVLGETWRIYQKDPSGVGQSDDAILPEAIQTDGVSERKGTIYATGSKMTITLDPTPVSILDFGIAHEEKPQEITVRMIGADGETALETTVSVPALDRKDYLTGYTTAFRLEGPATAIQEIELTGMESPGRPFTLLSPVLIRTSGD